jgi:hypothetical protein
MFSSIFRFFILTVVWWAVVWYVLPIDWDLLTIPSFVLLHIAPPVALASVWSAVKWFRANLKARREKAAKAAELAETQAKLDAARAEHEAALQRRRTFVDFRAIWASVRKMPEWFGGLDQCQIMEQVTGEFPERNATLSASLELIFESVLMQCKAVAWLPVVVVPNREMESDVQLALIQEAFQRATASSAIKQDIPPRIECEFLPGTGPVANRVIALFEDNPSIPALVLIGMDSSLDKSNLSPTDEQPGHTVVALLLGRVGLSTLPATEIAAYQKQQGNLYTPYWDKMQINEAALMQWGRVPLALHSELLTCPPLATLHQCRASTVTMASNQFRKLDRQIRALMKDALIDAALLDWPFEGDMPEDKAQESRKGEEEDDEPLEIGWVVHNIGHAEQIRQRLPLVDTVLTDYGCKIRLLSEVCNVIEEHGDTGAACEVLMLAEAAMIVAALQSSVLVARFDDSPGISFGLVRPVLPEASQPAGKRPVQRAA